MKIFYKDQLVAKKSTTGKIMRVVKCLEDIVVYKPYAGNTMFFGICILSEITEEIGKKTMWWIHTHDEL